jgi:centractin
MTTSSGATPSTTSTNSQQQQQQQQPPITSPTLGPERFILPDGRPITVGPERFQAPEILFNPDIIGREDCGVHTLVLNALSKVDLDLRKSLYESILLSGGSTLFRGFGDRLLFELRKDCPNTKIRIYSPPERKYSTWIGGSILAGLSSFRSFCVTYAEYEEDPDIIHKKMAG